MKPFDEHGAFRAATANDGLRRLAVRGAGVTVLSQNMGFAIQMIATMILARLLTPADFGLVAMVTTFSLLFMNVGFNGFTEAVIQREQVDHALASNLFWINVGIGLVLTITFAGAGSLLAQFYHDPRLARVAVAMSATIFFASISNLHLALLKRAMQFPVLSANDVAARLTSVTVSIVLGWAAWGYWALVAGAIALPLITCVGAWGRCRWMPALPRRRAGTGEMTAFAATRLGHFTANYCTRNLDNFLIGWFFGPQSLGFYKKAYDLCLLPVAQLTDPLHTIAVPILSRVSGDRARYQRYVLSALSTVAFVGMGVSAVLALVGKDLILVLLGPQWEEAGRIFTFFAPGIGAMLLYLSYTWIHLSLGRPDRLLRWGLIELTVIGLLFVLGLRWGPAGVAMAWVVSCWVLLLPSLWYAGKPAQIKIASLAGAMWKYVLASALAGITAAVIVRRIPFLVAASGWIGAVDRSITVSLLFAGLYVGAVIVLHGGCAPLYQMSALVREMLPNRVSRSAPSALAPAQ